MTLIYTRYAGQFGPDYWWTPDGSSDSLKSRNGNTAGDLVQTGGGALHYGDVVPGLRSLIMLEGDQMLMAPAPIFDTPGDFTIMLFLTLGVVTGAPGYNPTLVRWGAGPESRFWFDYDRSGNMLFGAGAAPTMACSRDIFPTTPSIVVVRRSGTLVDGFIQRVPMTFGTYALPAGGVTPDTLVFGPHSGGAIINAAAWGRAITNTEADGLFDVIVIEEATFFVLFACAIDARTIRVFLSEEPRARSPISGKSDALDRRTWSVANSIDSPVVVMAQNVQAQPAFDVDYPDAWSVDLVVDRRVFFDRAYAVSAALELENADGSSVIDPETASYTMPIGAADKIVVPLRPRSSRESYDVAYDMMKGVFPLTSSGDLRNHAAPASAKKRVLRRILTALNAFALLRDYGSNLRPKMLVRASNAAIVRAEVLRQLRRETDIEVESVSFDFIAPGVAFLKVVAAVKATGEPASVTARLRSGRLLLGDG